MTAPVRPCIGCGQYDDHPRHIINTADGTGVPYHMDCCAMARNCDVCRDQLAGAPQGATGERLREYLMTTGPGPDQPGWTAPAADSAKD